MTPLKLTKISINLCTGRSFKVPREDRGEKYKYFMENSSCMHKNLQRKQEYKSEWHCANMKTPATLLGKQQTSGQEEQWNHDQVKLVAKCRLPSHMTVS